MRCITGRDGGVEEWRGRAAIYGGVKIVEEWRGRAAIYGRVKIEVEIQAGFSPTIVLHSTELNQSLQ